MTDPIRIFIATDERSEQPDRVIEFSIRKHTEAEVDITFMRAGDPGWSMEEWNRGKPKGEWKPKGGGWGTAFSVFRFTVPELCGFEGKAIYMDSDIIVVGDIQDLWDQPMPKPWVSCGTKRTCVSLIDCKGMEGAFPRISAMKASGANTSWYRRELVRKGLLAGTLPKHWNCFDCVPRDAKAVHFTNMPTQPWCPWPEAMTYRMHPNNAARELWFRYEEASR